MPSKDWVQANRGRHEVEIVGIEMLSNPDDPHVVRVHCSRPKILALPAGKVEGWNITED